MAFLNGIIYDSIYHAVPILLCVLGGIFAYKANVLRYQCGFYSFRL